LLHNILHLLDNILNSLDNIWNFLDNTLIIALRILAANLSYLQAAYYFTRRRLTSVIEM
jgi:hypothetical protein